MSNIPTPHNTARKEQIAETVLMPGDPLRAKYVAENFLEQAECVNSVRNMLAYTGYYKGKRVTVMGSGMGIPSIGIYTYELYHFYDVKRIIRIGTTGGLQDDQKLRDVIIAVGACTDSNYADQYKLPGTFAPIATFSLAMAAANKAQELGMTVAAGNVLASDVFYCPEENTLKWKEMGVLGVEMESLALYMNAAAAHKEALTLLTVTDKPLTGEGMDAASRQSSLKEMITLALEIA